MLKTIKYLLSVAVMSGLLTAIAHAQSIDQVRWKSQDKVLALLGEPLSKSSPVGTHATYQLWTYDEFIIAFANQRAFHMFFKDGFTKTTLN